MISSFFIKGRAVELAEISKEQFKKRDRNRIIVSAIGLLFTAGFIVATLFLHVRLGLEYFAAPVLLVLLFHFLSTRAQSERNWYNPLLEEWRKTASEMGIAEIREPEPLNALGRYIGTKYQRGECPVEGNYRNHSISIYEVIHNKGGDSSWTETVYDVKFNNPKMILMQIKKRSVLSVFTQSIHTGDFEFDQEFQLKGNRESEIEAILDQPIRNKMMRISKFNIVISEKNPYVAHYSERGSILHTKEDPERFRAIVETMVNIVEKIEGKSLF
jgi:hypothetical protein